MSNAAISPRLIDCRHVLPSAQFRCEFSVSCTALATRLAEAETEAVNSTQASSIEAFEMNLRTRSSSGLGRRSQDTGAAQGRSFMVKEDQHAAEGSVSNSTRVDGNSPSLTMQFSEIFHATVRLFAATQTKGGQNFDTKADHKYSTQTPLALHGILDDEHLELVFIEKAYTRAAIVIEKNLWDTQQQVMVWTEFAEDSPADGMTIDYVSCRQEFASTGHLTWSMLPSDQSVSDLSHQASSAFVSYLNKIVV